MADDKQRLRLMNEVNVAIVSAYNDMLSAHQPYEHFPHVIKEALREVGSVGQFAGGVPAMCDGVTQGEPGMEMSLASREVIAMSTVVALSHNMFDAALMLGICDKIVPGLMIGALRFGYLPTVFVPGGPMPSGIPNKEKAEVRQRFAEGKATREELLDSEMKSYHSPGTCTFYGTANTNQVVMEIMGLHLPGASFVNPYTPMRDALTREAALQVTRLTSQTGNYLPLCRIVDEKSIVNSVVALNATGGSTNHTLHIPAFARAAGIQLTWEDMADSRRSPRPWPRSIPMAARRESLPRRRRRRFHGAHAARCRAAPRGRQHRDGARSAPLHPGALPGGRPAGVARGRDP